MPYGMAGCRSFSIQMDEPHNRVKAIYISGDFKGVLSLWGLQPYPYVSYPDIPDMMIHMELSHRGRDGRSGCESPWLELSCSYLEDCGTYYNCNDSGDQDTMCTTHKLQSQQTCIGR